LLRVLTGRLGSAVAPLAVAIAMVAFSGCGSVSSVVKPESSLLAGSQPPSASTPPSDSGPLSSASSEPVPTVVESPAIEPGAGQNGDGAAEVKVAQAETPQDKGQPGEPPADDEDYDPWEKFNEKMFEFNRQADRFVLKPIAKVYSVILPEPFEVMIGNGFDNMAFVPRLVNSLLQGKFGGAGREVSRFLINSTLGIGGLFDAAKYYGIEKSREDFGQTLGKWGVPAGPYVMLPIFGPSSVRDAPTRLADDYTSARHYISDPYVNWGLWGVEKLEVRASLLDLDEALDRTFDRYAFIRNA
jgi:phospholipid-binding lipoprotein MlaA